MSTFDPSRQSKFKHRTGGSRSGMTSQQKRRKIRTALLALLTILVVGFLSLFLLNENAQHALSQDRSMPDLSTAIDGVWYGSYTIWPVSAEVNVEIVDQKIHDIVLIKHFTGRGQGAEVLLQNALREQTLELDLISGATISSQAIIQAIREALLAAGATP